MVESEWVQVDNPFFFFVAGILRWESPSWLEGRS